MASKFCRLAAITVLYKRQATVQGPTPPGTGVMYPATSATLNKNEIEILKIFLQKYKVEKILKGRLDSISSPSPRWCQYRGGHWPPQYFAEQLTLFKPGRADYPRLLLLAPQCFSPSSITALVSFFFANSYFNFIYIII